MMNTLQHDDAIFHQLKLPWDAPMEALEAIHCN